MLRLPRWIRGARLVGFLGAGLLGTTVLPAQQLGSTRSSTETIDIRVREGTTLGFDLSADGRSIVFDLLGQLWLLPARGGDARPITDAVRDTAEDLDPSVSPDGRTVVFRGERAGRTGMWLLDVETRRIRQLTQYADPDGYEGQAAWSPDGRVLAFARAMPPKVPGGGRSLIVLRELASDTDRELMIEGLPQPHVRNPTWVREGRRIAFVAALAPISQSGRVWMVDAVGGRATPVTGDSVRALAPAFTRDGRRMAYFAPDTAGRMQVWVQEISSADTAIGAPTRITSHRDVAPTRVRWSADGRTVTYTADGRLWNVPVAGGQPHEIPFTARLRFDRPRRALPPARFPESGERQAARGFTGLAISPDGRRIAVLALGKLWVIPIGGDPRALADVPMSARSIAWAPNGDEVAWSGGPVDQDDVFATDLKTGATRRVTALPGAELFPVYSPDGGQLAFVHLRDEATLRVVDARATDLGDTASTRNLGVVATDGTSAPQWSPRSDGLLVTSGPNSDEAPGIFVTLSGERRSLSRFPETPLSLQWTAQDTLLWVRHDRLWAAPLGDSGLRADPRPLGSAPALYASAARDGTLLFVSEGGLRLRSPGGSERQLGWPLTYTPPVAPPLLLRNVRILDGTGAPPSAPRDLLVERGRIAAVVPPDSPAREGAEVIDGGGRIVIPGLIDLHAHTYQAQLLTGFLYFGVTTMRDQGSSMAPLVAYADAFTAGVLPGPRMAYGGFQFYSDWRFDDEQGRGVEPEADPDHAARAVALAEAFGAQHIKTRTFRRWDINARFVREAHRRGMRSTGHCAHPLPLVVAGIDAKEHFGACAPRGDDHMYDDLIQLLRVGEIGMVPTISYYSFAVRVNQHPEVLDADPEVAPFLPPREMFAWMLRMRPSLRNEFAAAAAGGREAAVALLRAGVTIGTGTDIWQVPTGVHMELEELVAAGLSPSEAIRAGTAAAARILGAADDLGTIAVGKRADLIILDADPLQDIRNTRRIWRVVHDGRVVDRAAILAGVQQHASASPN